MAEDFNQLLFRSIHLKRAAASETELFFTLVTEDEKFAGGSSDDALAIPSHSSRIDTNLDSGKNDRLARDKFISLFGA